MATQKIKIVGYVTQEQKDTIHDRARSLGMSIGAYCAELAMWDKRYNLTPQLRIGGTIVCNDRPPK